MSNMVQSSPLLDEFETPTPVASSVDLNDVRSVPRITLQAFCESEAVAGIIDQAANDRRMAKAHVKVHLGGIAAAVDFYSTAPTPNLIVVESRLTGQQLMGELGQLANVCDSETKVIVIGHLNDVTTYRMLVNNGVSEYLIAPLTMADIMNAVSDIFVTPDMGVQGKLVAFIGARGGAGSSTICHNIAWSISNRFQSDVVLADLDFAFGTANLNLNQDPDQGIADAVYSPDRMDDILLDRLLAKCAEHLSLLAAPSTLDRTYDFDGNAFNQIFEVAQRGTPMVVADVPNQWTDWSRQILSNADEVIITATPDLASLRNTKNLLDTLIAMRPNDNDPFLIINQVGVPKRPEINAMDFAQKLGMSPLSIIPFDPALFGTAANNGLMISETDPKHQTTSIFENAAQVITGRGELKPEKKSGLNLMGMLKFKKS